MSLTALILAVIALTVSAVSFVWTALWSIWQHRELTRGRLYVRASFAIVAGALGTSRVFAVTVTNAGMVPVTINSVSGTVKGAKQYFVMANWLLQTPTHLPVKLQTGDTWSGHFDLRELADAVATIAPRSDSKSALTIVVTDAARRNYEAPAVKLPL